MVGVVSPFNFPAMVPLWFFPIAIAAGNTVVLKPSEKDPSPAVWMAALMQEAACPTACSTSCTATRRPFDALLDHDDVAAVSFVGSTPIARYVYERGTAAGKRVQALGGARTTLLVLPDADLDLVATPRSTPASAPPGSAAWPSRSSWRSTPSPTPWWPRCASGWPPCAPVTAVVPATWVRSSPASTATRSRATSSGRRRRCRRRPSRARGRGRRRAPTASGSALPGRPGADDLGGLQRRDLRNGALGGAGRGYEEGVALINASPYGNGTAIFTHDGGAARRFQREVEAGMVGVNVPIPVPWLPLFGGWKASLFGDTKAYGTHGVDFYTREKTVTSRWLRPSHGGVDLGFPRNS